jgi:hypothetical protein
MGDNVALDVIDVKYDFIDGIELGIQWHAYVNVVMNSG